ncbi:hypothetical protein QCA50_011560 [Cerrena zonata]|uniref:Kinetochore protein Sos7 coiled-coil domain-containing protein n=1 Tax=Cerrena zonata TaxID=2478898 RepID=A0AAW0G6A2_9APHY
MTSHEKDLTAAVEHARKLQGSLDSANLNLVNSKHLFDTRAASEDIGLNLALSSGENAGGLVDPAMVSNDLAEKLSFFRKLKFQYLEHKAKNQYIKIIVSDDAPDIKAADNEKLRQANEKKKEVLKEAKLKLAETQENVQKLAPLVEEDYVKARALTKEAATLAQQILDAKLQLSRLRQIHPQPRLTIAAATAQADAQDEKMQSLDEELQVMNENVEEVKGRVKEGAKYVERLRMERAEAEKQVKACKNEVEDGRVMGLYDWYTAALKTHKELCSLESHQATSENELRLTYSLDKPNGARKRVIITLLFVPNTRRLAEAQVEGISSSLEEVIGVYTLANDVSGLIAALLAMARADQ